MSPGPFCIWGKRSANKVVMGSKVIPTRRCVETASADSEGKGGCGSSMVHLPYRFIFIASFSHKMRCIVVRVRAVPVSASILYSLYHWENLSSRRWKVLHLLLKVVGTWRAHLEECHTLQTFSCWRHFSCLRSFPGIQSHCASVHQYLSILVASFRSP